MRPATLAEALERIVAGQPREKALPEFLDTFYLAPTDAARMKKFAGLWPEAIDGPIEVLHPMLLVTQQPVVKPHQSLGNRRGLFDGRTTRIA